MWYLLSWRDLRRRSNAGDGLLNKPEITPPSHSNHCPDATPRTAHPPPLLSGCQLTECSPVHSPATPLPLCLLGGPCRRCTGSPSCHNGSATGERPRRGANQLGRPPPEPACRVRRRQSRTRGHPAQRPPAAQRRSWQLSSPHQQRRGPTPTC